MTNNPNPPAGWYPDPSNPLNERLWDGETWTEKSRPARPSAPVTTPPVLPSLPSSRSLTPPSAGHVHGDAAPKITFGEAIKEGFSNFANFNGRASRRAYWLFVLFCFLVNVGEGLLLGTSILSVVLLLPALAAGVRRMHDLNRSGWFIIIPFAGLYYACQPGDAGTNRYGPPAR